MYGNNAFQGSSSSSYGMPQQQQQLQQQSGGRREIGSNGQPQFQYQQQAQSAMYNANGASYNNGTAHSPSTTTAVGAGGGGYMHHPAQNQQQAQHPSSAEENNNVTPYTFTPYGYGMPQSSSSSSSSSSYGGRPQAQAAASMASYNMPPVVALSSQQQQQQQQPSSYAAAIPGQGPSGGYITQMPSSAQQQYTMPSIPSGRQASAPAYHPQSQTQYGGYANFNSSSSQTSPSSNHNIGGAGGGGGGAPIPSGLPIAAGTGGGIPSLTGGAVHAFPSLAQQINPFAPPRPSSAQQAQAQMGQHALLSLRPMGASAGVPVAAAPSVMHASSAFHSQGHDAGMGGMQVPRAAAPSASATSFETAATSQRPTYIGFIKTTEDAIKLLAATDLPDNSPNSPPRRIQRRLLDNERVSLIRSGSVFVWDEKEAAMRRWTDGRCWSASRVSGCFLTYRELHVRKHRSSHAGIGPTHNQYKTDGLIKQSFSMTTTSGRKMHIISYYTKRDARECLLRRVTEDGRFVNENGSGWNVVVDENEFPDPALNQPEFDDEEANASGSTETPSRKSSSGSVQPILVADNKGRGPERSGTGAGAGAGASTTASSSRSRAPDSNPVTSWFPTYSLPQFPGFSQGPSRGAELRFPPLGYYQNDFGGGAPGKISLPPFRNAPLLPSPNSQRFSGAINGRNTSPRSKAFPALHGYRGGFAAGEGGAGMTLAPTPLSEARGLLPIDPIPMRAGHVESRYHQTAAGAEGHYELAPPIPQLSAAVEQHQQYSSKPLLSIDRIDNPSTVPEKSLEKKRHSFPSTAAPISNAGSGFKSHAALLLSAKRGRQQSDSSESGSGSDGSGTDDGFCSSIVLPTPRRPRLHRLRSSSFSEVRGTSFQSDSSLATTVSSGGYSSSGGSSNDEKAAAKGRSNSEEEEAAPRILVERTQSPKSSGPKSGGVTMAPSGSEQESAIGALLSLSAGGFGGTSSTSGSASPYARPSSITQSSTSSLSRYGALPTTPSSAKASATALPVPVPAAEMSSEDSAALSRLSVRL